MSVDDDLDYLGLTEKRNQIMILILVISLVLAIFNPVLAIFPYVGLVVLVPALAELKRTRIKRSIPETAMEMSNLWGLIPIADLLKRSRIAIIRSAGEMIEKGLPVRRALEWVIEEEPVLEQLIEVIIVGYETGADASQMLGDLANEYSEELALGDEINANLTVERLSMLVAGGFLVPFILGVTVSLTDSLGHVQLEVLEVAVPRSTIEMATLGSLIYSVAYSAITGIYLGLSSGSIKRGLAYLLLLTPLAFFIFNISSSLAL